MGAFWKDAWVSHKAVVGPLATAAALVLALSGSFWDPGIKIPIGLIWLVVFLLVTAIVLATLINMTLVARRAARAGPPRAIHAFAPDEAGSVTLVPGKSRLFGVNIFVTIYYIESLSPGQDDVFERAIGIGRVINIQENGLIQVLVLREVPSHADLWQRIRSREMATLGQVPIKPSIDFHEAGVEVRFDE